MQRGAGSVERLGVIHVHSNYSADGRDSLEALREFGLSRGLQFIGLTDHAEDLTDEIFDHFVIRCEELSDERLRFYPGLEFRFSGYPGLHLLTLNLRRWIEPRSPEEFVKQARRACELTVLAHPILTRYSVPSIVARSIDAVEVWNARYNTRFLPDVRAIRLYQALRRERPELLAVVGLDQHDSSNDREVRLLVTGAAEASPFELVREGHYVNIGRTMRLTPDVGWGPSRTAAWGAARWMFDRVERVQNRISLTLRPR